MTEAEIATIVERQAAGWIRSAASFARVIDCRGLAEDQTIHVVDASALPMADGSPVGWTAPGVEAILRGAGVLSDPRHGPVVVLDCQAIGRSRVAAAAADAYAADVLGDLETRRVLLHELGHVVETAASGSAAIVATLPVLMAAVGSPRGSDVEDRHHGRDWIRAYLHAAGRAASICWPREWWLDEATAEIGDYLLASPAEAAEIAESLAQEIEEAADEPLVEVLRREPPPAFSLLVDRLVARRREIRLATLRSLLMASTLDSLRQRSQDRSDHALDVLAKAARDQAAGQEVDVAAVDAALHELRLGVDDFAAMVETATRRRDAVADLEKLAAARNRRDKAAASLAAESERIDAAVAAFRDRAAALAEQVRQAEAIVAAAEAARRVLLDAAAVPGTAGRRYREAIASRQEATSRVEKLARELYDVEEEIRRQEAWIRDVAKVEPSAVDPSRWQASPGVPKWQADGHDGELDRHHRHHLRAVRRRDELNKEIKAARDSLAAATREADAAEAAALKA